MATLQEQLESVETAIAAAEQAQSISSDGRTLQRANIAELYKRRDILAARIARANGNQKSNVIKARPET